ncbi:MAG: hypothetical protein N2508_01005 [Anaerolineae bacterium]|nr:hypothetical protein [Anaerolineae bacterium]
MRGFAQDSGKRGGYIRLVRDDQPVVKEALEAWLALASALGGENGIFSVRDASVGEDRLHGQKIAGAG